MKASTLIIAAVIAGIAYWLYKTGMLDRTLSSTGIIPARTANNVAPTTVTQPGGPSASDVAKAAYTSGCLAAVSGASGSPPNAATQLACNVNTAAYSYVAGKTWDGAKWIGSEVGGAASSVYHTVSGWF